jgi:hypothetical protein
MKNEISTEVLLYGEGTKAANSDTVGCYMIDGGKLLIRVKPLVPVVDGKPKLTIKDLVALSNEVMWTLFETVERCSGKKWELPKPGGVFAPVPSILSLFGVKWWEKRPVS